MLRSLRGCGCRRCAPLARSAVVPLVLQSLSVAFCLGVGPAWRAPGALGSPPDPPSSRPSPLSKMRRSFRGGPPPLLGALGGSAPQHALGGYAAAGRLWVLPLLCRCDPSWRACLGSSVLVVGGGLYALHRGGTASRRAARAPLRVAWLRFRVGCRRRCARPICRRCSLVARPSPPLRFCAGAVGPRSVPLRLAHGIHAGARHIGAGFSAPCRPRYSLGAAAGLPPARAPLAGAALVRGLLLAVRCGVASSGPGARSRLPLRALRLRARRGASPLGFRAPARGRLQLARPPGPFPRPSPSRGCSPPSSAAGLPALLRPGNIHSAVTGRARYHTPVLRVPDLLQDRAKKRTLAPLNRARLSQFLHIFSSYNRKILTLLQYSGIMEEAGRKATDDICKQLLRPTSGPR